MKLSPSLWFARHGESTAEYGFKDIVLNVEALEQHAKDLAFVETVKCRKTRCSFFPALEDDEKTLKKAYMMINEEAGKERQILPAAQWLHDNYYLIEEQLKDIELNYSIRHYKSMPWIQTAAHSFLLPRVYYLAAEMVTHTNCAVTEEIITNFFCAYQSEDHLLMNEIWAIPMMLKIALIKSAGTIAAHYIESRRYYDEAEKAAQAARESGKRENGRINDVLRRYESMLKPAFVERFMRILRDEKVPQSVFVWLDKRLERKGTTADRMIQTEHKAQAQNKALISNAITTLRMLAALTWEDIFEELSAVEKTLREDPVYKAMDFDTRDCYRKRIETLARKLNVSEKLVAAKAVECTKNHEGKPAHTGYYLLDAGIGELLRDLYCSPTLGMRITDSIKKKAAQLYVFSIFTVAAAFILLAVLYAYSSTHLVSLSVIACILSFLPATGAAVTIVNKTAASIVSPAFIPKMDFSEQIPVECATMVVVPALLADEETALEIISKVEVYYIANNSANLYFSLLGDFRDSSRETEEGEERIAPAALRAVEALNGKYAKDVPIFYYVHRKRRFNEKEGLYTGYERKRGALMDFNKMLLGRNVEGIEALSLPLPAGISYVITLDADTQLPRDAAQKLIGASAHPLNRPVLDETTGTVKEGYGIMQPRIGITVKSALRSVFAMVFSGEAGIDTYAKAVSDPYMDLTGEGIYTGKGIYDLATFMAVIEDKIRDNTVLSHDLLEGSLARTALVSDVELIDGYPSQYSSWARREHRWIRGDWQLLPWLMPRIKYNGGGKEENPLSFVSRWKIFDNLRRSMQPVFSVTLALLGFCVLGGNPLAWLIFAVLPILASILIQLADHAAGSARKPSGTRGDRPAREALRAALQRHALQYLFLPHEAQMGLDAVLRTLWRLAVSKKNMLQWVTAADADRKGNGGLTGYWWMMSAATAVALALNILALIFMPVYWPAAFLVSIPWFMSPYTAWSMSQKPVATRIQLGKNEIQVLRMLARKTWRYFEEFTETNPCALVPDNFQHTPRRGIAQRTSPTNIGLSILSRICACLMGYVTLPGMLSYLEKIMGSIEKMSKWNGHLYNWYDTMTLKPLRPMYVSTVDSGNLAGYLIAGAETVKYLLGVPVFDPSKYKGMMDTLSVLAEYMSRNEADENIAPIQLALRSAMESTDFSSATCISGWLTWVEAIVSKNITEGRNGRKAVGKLLEKMCQDASTELQNIAPWARLLQRLPDGVMNSGEALQKLDTLLKILGSDFSINLLVEKYDEILGAFSQFASCVLGSAQPLQAETTEWIKKLEIGIASTYHFACGLKEKAEQLAAKMGELALKMDFARLYDEKRGLFSIGLDVDSDRISNSYYDLFASEARLASFLAIAKGDVPQKHWFKLGRPLTMLGNRRVLLSWGGTIFEYLMPQVIMKNHEMTLMGETCKSVIEAQRKWGAARHVPWGASESGYYAFDMNMNYQYKAFGIPKLGFKSGLAKDTVVAPYASCLALLVAPAQAFANIKRLMAEGMVGDYGFFESLDYTDARLGPGKKGRVVKCYMAHHQGIIFTAIFNVLTDNLLQKLFHGVPMIRATELLLEEKIPVRATIVSDFSVQEYSEPRAPRFALENFAHEYEGIPSGIPQTHLLSNGSYSVMVTTDGTGYSALEDIQLSRWRPDAFSRQYGMYFYIKETLSGRLWSAAHQPICSMPSEYSVKFEPDKALFSRTDGDIHTRMEICVSPEINAEFRRITLSNRGRETAKLELTGYFELCLSSMDADMAHSSFSKLFIQTEWLADAGVLFAWRRDDGRQRQVFCAFSAVADEKFSPMFEIETDRLRFLGRGRGPGEPSAAEEGARLSGSTGCVIDPAMSIRRSVTLAPKESASITFILSAAKTRKKAMENAADCSSPDAVRRAFDLAWTHSQVEVGYLGIKPHQAIAFQRAASMFILHPGFKKGACRFEDEKWLGRHELWRYGISGDIPIAVMKINDAHHLSSVREALLAHEFWNLHGLKVDLVIVSSYADGYYRLLHEQILEIVNASRLREKSAGHHIHVLDEKDMESAHLGMLEQFADLVLDAAKEEIEDQIGKYIRPARSFFPKGKSSYAETDLGFDEKALLFFNGYGGFRQDGTYEILLKEGKTTPMPWCNVLANEIFGAICTESGSGHTWAYNSQLNMLTPWFDDDVIDHFAEAIYIKDTANNLLWNATAGPCTQQGDRIIRHGYGFSEYISGINGIRAVQTVFVAKEQPLKVVRLTLRNESPDIRRISLTYFARFSLTPPIKAYVQPKSVFFDDESGALLTQAPETPPCPRGLAFICAPGREVTYTADLAEFLGGESSMRAPAALGGNNGLSGAAGSGIAACSALMTEVELEPGEEKETVFLMGYAPDLQGAREMSKRFLEKGATASALKEVKESWEEKLGRLQVCTPDDALGMLMNGRLLYQIYASRLFGRASFYQAGGAYGFRDQLQDVLALLAIDPERARSHILLCAGRQFEEGDVLHWWHPPARGVRMGTSDDRLFLPYAVAEYIEGTGDEQILFKIIPYIQGPPIPEGECSWYGDAQTSRSQGTVLEHCIRAIDVSLKFGTMGLPLMLRGDWNDAMDMVGEKGAGESVWLGFFLAHILERFAPLCMKHGYPEKAAVYKEQAAALAQNIQKNAWDGNWYIRAFFDDGTPLGSAKCPECRIDSVVQSWAVISGLSPADRMREAMTSAVSSLWDSRNNLIRILAPPFDTWDVQPGYIKGYLPGVRENGGQYTHASAWFTIALAKLGWAEEAYESLRLLNPIDRSDTRYEADIYKTEPYSVAADVYTAPGQEGRGGWTWYTGSAAWFYRAALEWILGFKKRGSTLQIKPVVPLGWSGFSIDYQYGISTYFIKVMLEQGTGLTVDGKPQEGEITLVDDGRSHQVEVRITRD
ncbi:MAG: glucoamylase family protein [Bacillota bacterium]|nr:glucoamylase family protein [Bacillota bacterium]